MHLFSSLFAPHHRSGGSRNVERGVRGHIDSAPPKAVRRAAKRRSVRAKRGKFFLRVPIRKRSRSISAHSGHVPKKID